MQWQVWMFLSNLAHKNPTCLIQCGHHYHLIESSLWKESLNSDCTMYKLPPNIYKTNNQLSPQIIDHKIEEKTQTYHMFSIYIQCSWKIPHLVLNNNYPIDSENEKNMVLCTHAFCPFYLVYLTATIQRRRITSNTVMNMTEAML